MNKGQIIGRITAALLGGVLLIIAAICTAGGAIGALAGVVVAAIIARKQQRGLSRRASWLGAVIGSAVVLAGLAAALFGALPSGTYAQAKRASDSASATVKPPAWVERMSPGTGAAMRQKQKPTTGFGRAFELWAGVTGAVLALAFFAAIVGSVGWLATLPLAFAWRGQWLPWQSEPPTDWLRDVG